MYNWAANHSKLQRAIAKGGTEEQIKQTYIQMGGLILGTEIPLTEQVFVQVPAKPEDLNNPVIEIVNVSMEEVPSIIPPKKRGRPKKNVE